VTRTEERQTDLHITRWGEAGAPALLVHGSMTNGEMTWAAQRPLAERVSLLLLDRRGYYPNPPMDEAEDFEVDAADVMQLLVEHGPLHLVGHSYGAIASLLAAGRLPRCVRSLTVVEPPAFGVVPDHPAVKAMVTSMEEYWRDRPRDPIAFLRGYLALSGSPAMLPDPLPPVLAQSARRLRDERSPGEAVIPSDELRRAGFPVLVASGGHDPAYEAICDVIAGQTGARRVVLEGAGHAVPRLGAPFNEELGRLWRSAPAPG
jgi:pimeloyl-ACP methyl ester carboxylesterase